MSMLEDSMVRAAKTLITHHRGDHISTPDAKNALKVLSAIRTFAEIQGMGLLRVWCVREIIQMEDILCLRKSTW